MQRRHAWSDWEGRARSTDRPGAFRETGQQFRPTSMRQRRQELGAPRGPWDSFDRRARFGDTELPAELQDVLRRARRLEWVSLAYLATAITLLYLVMGSSQAMKAAWLEDLLADIGLGNRMAYMIAQKLVPEHEDAETPAAPESRERQSSLAIRGSEGMVMNYAKCCHPIPGDPIIGHISTGRGMVIHTETCNNIADIRDNPEKCVSVRWDPNVEGEFSVEIRVELENERGIIAKLATAITSTEANIEKISTVERDARFSIVNLSLNVRNRIHLARVMKRIRLIKPVTRVVRVKSRKVVKTIKGSIAPQALKRTQL